MIEGLLGISNQMWNRMFLLGEVGVLPRMELRVLDRFGRRQVYGSLGGA